MDDEEQRLLRYCTHCGRDLKGKSGLRWIRNTCSYATVFICLLTLLIISLSNIWITMHDILDDKQYNFFQYCFSGLIIISCVIIMVSRWTPDAVTLIVA